MNEIRGLGLDIRLHRPEDMSFDSAPATLDFAIPRTGRMIQPPAEDASPDMDFANDAGDLDLSETAEDADVGAGDDE
jgi:hypothetical protein